MQAFLDQCIDYSTCGYRGGGVPLPISADEAHTIVLSSSPEGQDDTPRVQAALDRAANLADDTGAVVLLQAGVYRLEGSLRFSKPNVRLVGQVPFPGEQGAVLHVYGPHRTLVTLTGSASKPKTDSKRERPVVLPLQVGASTISVPGHDFRAGESILLRRPCTAHFVAKLGMDTLSRHGEKQTWLCPSTHSFYYDREIVAVQGDTLLLDTVLPESIDEPIFAAPYTFPGRLTGVGLARLTWHYMDAAKYSTSLSAPQMVLVSIHAAADCFLTHLVTHNFSSGVSIDLWSKRITVQSCHFHHTMGANVTDRGLPAEIAFSGSQVLIKDCRTTGKAWETFCVCTQARCMGPNAIVHYTADGPRHIISPHQRWATGLLIDDCTLQNISLMNRGVMGSGHGWTAAYCTAWQCQCGSMLIESPPGTINTAVGCTGNLHPKSNGLILPNVLPDVPSLYRYQLHRAGKRVV